MVDVDPASSASEPSLVDAVIHVFELGQRVVLDRVDLARFDLTQLARRLVRGAALIVIGAVLLAGAWFALMGAAVVGLQAYLSLVSSLILIAGLSAVIGAGTVAIGVRRTRNEGDAGMAGELVAPTHHLLRR